MSTIITRAGKGTPLTHAEVDANFTNLNTDKAETAGPTFTGAVKVAAGTAAAPSLAISGDPNTGLYSPGADQVALATAGTERMRIDSAGNTTWNGVGIKLTTGRSIASTADNSNVAIFGGDITTNPGANIELYGGTHATLANLMILDANEHRFRTANGATERMRIDSAGNVGIGAAPGSYKLDVQGGGQRILNQGTTSFLEIGNGTTTSQTAFIDLTTDTTYTDYGLRIIRDGAGGANGVSQLAQRGTGELSLRCLEAAPLTFYTTNTERARIDSSGRVGIGTTTPSTTLTVNGTTKVQNAASFAGINIQNNNDSSVVTTTSFLDASNNLGTIDGHLFFEHLTTGGSNAIIATTPVGDRAVDRRVNRLSIGAAGTTTLNSATSTAPFIAQIAGAEAARIDSSGRLLVGTSTARNNYYSSITPGGIQNEVGSLTLFQNSNSTSGSAVFFGKSRGTTVNSNTVVQAGDQLGTVVFMGADGTNVWPGAQITGEVDGTPGANDMPGRLVFSTTADGAASPTERLRITNDGVQAYNQPAPAAINATATLTAANLKAGIITSTSAAATDMTLPTGTDTQAGFSGTYDNMTFEWSVINTGPSLVRVLAGTAHTVVGSGSVATGTSGRFASRRTAANTFVTYRLA